MADNPSIDQAFITQFEEEVKLDYQRMGSRFYNMVRKSENVVGNQIRFQKMGTGEAGPKARHGDVPVLNLDHSYVNATIEDAYGAEYVDRLDMLKTNIDERSAVSRSIVAAMGRSVDNKIETAMQAGTNEDTTDAALTTARVITAQEFFNTNDVPMDGDRFMAIGPQQWSDLMVEAEFVNADYVGFDQMPFKGGLTAKRWLDFLVFPYTGLTKVGSDRHVKAWHKISMGLGVGTPFHLEVNYVPQKVAWLIAGMESCGAVIIDNDGVYKIHAKET